MPIDPLVIDLGGNGIGLSAAGAGALFDLDNDGFRESVGWFGSDDGLLAIDTNQNGIIDNATELFGTDEIDRFTNLVSQDTNSDGVIDTNDNAFVDLRVWIDVNGDGVTDTGELHTLSELGIAAINLSATVVDQVKNRNIIHSTSNVLMSDGSTREVAAVFLDIDQQTSRVIPPSGFVASADAHALPELAGNGNVADLSYAMSTDAALLSLVGDLVTSSNTMSSDDFRQAAEEVLLAWTGGYLVEQSSRGQYVNAQHLAVIEAFWSVPYTVFGAPVVELHNQAGTFIEAAYDSLLDGIAARLFVQSVCAWFALNDTAGVVELFAHPAFIFSNLAYDSESDEISGSIVDSVALLSQILNLGTTPDLGKLSALAGENEGGFFNLLERAFYNSDHSSFVSDIKGGLEATIPDASSALIDAYVGAIEGASLLGTDTPDSLLGTSVAEIIFGGQGDDTLDGAAGDDTYVYGLGDGHDTISESYLNGSADKLVFGEGILSSEVVLSRVGDSNALLLTSVDGGSIAIANEFYEVGSSGVEQIFFNDGTVWDRGTSKRVCDEHIVVST